MTHTRCCTVCVCVGQSADAVVWTLAAQLPVQSLLLTAPWLPGFISAYVTMLESKAEVGCKSCSGIAGFLQGIQMIACRHMTSVPLSHTVMAGGRLLVQFQPETQIIFGLCKKGHPCGDCVDPVPRTCSGTLMEASAAPGASVTPQRLFLPTGADLCARSSPQWDTFTCRVSAAV